MPTCRSVCAEWVKSEKAPLGALRAQRKEITTARCCEYFLRHYLSISEHENVVLAELVAMP
jgi:hypothetical protein